ncbi:MAG TPA: helix-turn-helix domain-containing protein [Candidatus Limnocylindria bacterium]
MSDRLADQIARISVLDEPVRRALYLYVSRQPEPVGREEAADAAGTTRENAAFHLDKLAQEGLLETSFRRLSKKTGPGAGRPSKLYRRSARQLQVAVPARRYELAAELFAQALEAEGGRDARRSVAAAAREFGASLGAAAHARPGRASVFRKALDVLEEQGFEPSEMPRGVVRLRNCPFDALARAHRDLVCGMNLAFMEGVVAGLRGSGIQATFDPQPGLCCVTLSASRGASASRAAGLPSGTGALQRAARPRRSRRS